MMIHIVLLQPKTETSSEEMKVALKQVQALQEMIPGIIDIQAGENVSKNHQGYTHGFIIRFVDNNHLKAYAPHEAHRIVSHELVRICHSIIDFDIEQPETL